jgi:hypothetical protein
MIPLKIRVVVLGLALVACGDRAPKGPKMADVFPNLPLPPQATFVSRSGGAEALQITLRSSRKADEVVAYYRATFKTGGWNLVSDVRDAEGAVVLLAKQKGPPLWVRIRSTEDSAASLVELSGAVSARDSTSAGQKS